MSERVKVLFVHVVENTRGWYFHESLSLGMESKSGDIFPLTADTRLGLVAYKYLEGSVKRTLERELNVPELADAELNGSTEQTTGFLPTVVFMHSGGRPAVHDMGVGGLSSNLPYQRWMSYILQTARVSIGSCEHSPYFLLLCMIKLLSTVFDVLVSVSPF